MGGKYSEEYCCLTLVNSHFLENFSLDFCLLFALDLHYDQKDAILFGTSCAIGNWAVIKAYVCKVTQ